MACAMIAEAVDSLDNENLVVPANIPLKGIAGPWLGDNWKDYADLSQCGEETHVAINFSGFKGGINKIALSITIPDRRHLHANCYVVKVASFWEPREIVVFGDALTYGKRTFWFKKLDNEPGVYQIVDTRP